MEIKKIQVRIAEELHHKFKVMCADKRISQQEFIIEKLEEAIEEYEQEKK